jgi:hypothetical protein
MPPFQQRDDGLTCSTTSAAKLLAFVELVMSPSSYTSLQSDAADVQSTIVAIIAKRGWIESLVVSMEKLIASSVSLDSVCLGFEVG